MSTRAIGSHQSAIFKTDVWLTPPEIIQSLGQFDLDPCSPVTRPWDTAKVHYTKADDGLSLPWFGDVWLNPPYGKFLAAWMKRMSEHLSGVSLVFARTETAFFQRYIFPFADSILFIDGRLHFYNQDGIRAKANAGAPSVLIAYGGNNIDRISDSRIKGKHVLINSMPVIVVGVSPTWKSVISIAVSRANGIGHLQEIYDLVERIAPDKCEKNGFFKEQIRKVLQESFTRIGKGIYSNLNN